MPQKETEESGHLQGTASRVIWQISRVREGSKRRQMLDNYDGVRIRKSSQEVGILTGRARVKEGFHHKRDKIKIVC